MIDLLDEDNSGAHPGFQVSRTLDNDFGIIGRKVSWNPEHKVFVHDGRHLERHGRDGELGFGGIAEPRSVQKANSYQFLRHLGQWNGTPPLAPARSPPEAGAWAREPCEDVDPMPDYENVLTD